MDSNEKARAEEAARQQQLAVGAWWRNNPNNVNGDNYGGKK